MLNIELSELGVEDVLDDISERLELAIKSKSKKQKNEIIYRVLGALNTLRFVINITETEEQSSNDLSNHGE